jgi:hypothetical protein
MSIRSVHSARIVLAQCSAYAFISGHYGADFPDLDAFGGEDGVKASVNLLSRIRKWNGPAR